MSFDSSGVWDCDNVFLILFSQNNSVVEVISPPQLLHDVGSMVFDGEMNAWVVHVLFNVQHPFRLVSPLRVFEDETNSAISILGPFFLEGIPNNCQRDCSQEGQVVLKGDLRRGLPCDGREGGRMKIRVMVDCQAKLSSPCIIAESEREKEVEINIPSLPNACQATSEISFVSWLTLLDETEESRAEFVLGEVAVIEGVVNMPDPFFRLEGIGIINLRLNGIPVVSFTPKTRHVENSKATLQVEMNITPDFPIGESILSLYLGIQYVRENGYRGQAEIHLDAKMTISLPPTLPPVEDGVQSVMGPIPTTHIDVSSVTSSCNVCIVFAVAFVIFLLILIITLSYALYKRSRSK